MSAVATPDAGTRFLRDLLGDGPGEWLDPPVGADPDGPFCAVVSTAEQPRVWAPSAGWTARLEVGATTWVLAQVRDSLELTRAAPAPTGVGAVRHGALGARQSVIDAGLALVVSGGQVASFDEDWVLATVDGARERQADVCAAGGVVAAASRHLAKAVQAVADHRLSVVGAARALHIHPNTVIYRLERWRGLTGWDPRTLRGLAASIACLQVAP